MDALNVENSIIIIMLVGLTIKSDVELAQPLATKVVYVLYIILAEVLAMKIMP